MDYKTKKRKSSKTANMYIEGEKNGGAKVTTENGTDLVSEKTKEEGDEEDLPIATPPDGGWGWAVVFASFMIHIIGKLKLNFYGALLKT